MQGAGFSVNLENAIRKMTPWQTGLFMTIASARCMALFSDAFFGSEDALRFLNMQFLSLGKNLIMYFDKPNTYTITNESKLVIDLDSKLEPNNDTTIARILATTLTNARELAKNKTFSDNHQVATNFGRLLRFVLNASLSLENRSMNSILLYDARIILKSFNYHAQSPPLQNITYFCENLKTAGAVYWASWFEELFASNFQLSASRHQELLSLDESQYGLTIAQTSTILLARCEGTRVFNEARLIVLGNKGSGKTTFARRFLKLKAKMPKKKESTPGVDFHHVKAGTIDPKGSADEDFIIHIWDFAGHAVTHAAHKFFLSDRATYVIVLGGRKEEGSGTSINEWLEHITYYASGSAEDKIKVYIVVNQTDANLPRVNIDPKYHEKFDIESDCIINLHKDNKPGGALDMLRKRIVRHMMSHKKEIPACIFKIKKDIEDEFAGVNNASKSQVEQIIKKHTRFLPEDILHILHAYGICFFYDKLQGEDRTLQADAVVLNPRWVTYAIYGLINFIQNDKERIDGHITIAEFEQAFEHAHVSPGSYQKHVPKLSIPPDRYPFISMLAQTFGLAYEKNHFLIFPICLPDNYPGKKRGLGNPDSSDFFVEVTTNTERSSTSPVTIPKDVIPAFIVKRHMNLLSNETYCSHKGIVLEHPKNRIKAEVKRISDYQIIVLVKGNQQASCDFGADLVGDLYHVIQKYKVFQDEQTRPAVKITFVDKYGSDQSFDIAAILARDWIENLVEHSKLSNLKRTARNIGERLSFGFSAKKTIGQTELGTEVKYEPSSQDGKQ